jgi:hypothetical protein
MGKVVVSVLAGVILLAGVSQLFAGEPRHNPCAAEAAAFCTDVQPGGGTMIACLRQHDKELSQGCKEYLSGLREKGRDFVRGCRGDIGKFCRGMKPGGGMLLKCLKEHEAELSEGCRVYFTNQ